MNREPEFDPALEAELRNIAPAPLDEPLLDRLGHAVQTKATPQPTMTFGWKFWLMPGMAVTALAMILTLKPGPTLTPQPPAPNTAAAPMQSAQPTEEPIDLFPAHRYNEVASSYEGNIINLPDQPPYRHVRVRMVDTYTWEDPNGATRVEFTVPRDEHFLLPAEIH